jgi:hypothetical protein
VSGPTLRVLRDTDAAAVAAAAGEWLALADGIDDSAEELIRGSRDLEHAWPRGAASEAAGRRAAVLRAEVSNAYAPCRRIGQALREHADTVRALQESLRQVTESATAAGLRVDIAAGTVTAPARMYAGTSRPDLVARQVSGYVGQLRSVLDQAAELDARTANMIAVNLPDAKAGFGSLSLAPVTERTLRDQAGRTPAEVAAWWDTLTPELQEQAIAGFPQLVGWLDGVPAADRDTANRILLERDLADLRTRDAALADRQAYLRMTAAQGRLAEAYPGSMNPLGSLTTELDRIGDQRADLAARLAGPTEIQHRIGDPDKPPVFLLGYDPAGDGKAIVSVHNPDLADNVLTYVPGTTADLNGIRGDLQRADVMAADAADLDPTARTASILWLGYDAPDWFNNAASSSYAQNGAGDLRDFESGLRATHEGATPAQSTVLGHSYGTTTVGYAAKDGHLPVDNVVFVGSPGVGVDTAGDLRIDGGPQNVWASTAANDVIRLTGVDDTMRFGENPANPGFGGRTFTSADGSLSPVATHSEYWDQGNPSRRNIALIVTGKTSGVS